MSIKDIITIPDEILRKTSSPVEKIGKNEKNLIKNLDKYIKKETTVY